MRTFIALELPVEIRAKLAHVTGILERSGIFQGSFVGKDNFHLTVKFLGEVSEERLEVIKSALSNVNLPPFLVKVENIRFFPSQDYIKIIWTGITGNEIKPLCDRVNEQLVNIGFPQDTKLFQAHITLARISGVKDKSLLQKKLASVHFAPIEFKVSELAIFKSELTSRGAVYKKLASIPFKK